MTEYVRDYIAALRRRDMSYRAIAEHLDCTPAWVQYLDKPEDYGEKTVGPELEQRVADILHGGSIDALRRVAVNFGQELVQPPAPELPAKVETVPPPKSNHPPKGIRPQKSGPRIKVDTGLRKKMKFRK